MTFLEDKNKIKFEEQGFVIVPQLIDPDLRNMLFSTLSKVYTKLNPEKEVEFKGWECDLFFNMNIFHRSGINKSSKFRFTAGLRFHRILTKDFIPGLLHYKYNEVIQSQIIQYYAKGY